MQLITLDVTVRRWLADRSAYLAFPLCRAVLVATKRLLCKMCFPGCVAGSLGAILVPVTRTARAAIKRFLLEIADVEVNASQATKRALSHPLRPLFFFATSRTQQARCMRTLRAADTRNRSCNTEHRITFTSGG